ncbi:helix-turn-helix domain-containing protein [Actinomadura sp. 9N215]|uniref:helix-turn-helix domain-containing protein n=1 Tax=Actinomadura sp. 9N215 TaxID=3375150 RepID=UPI00378792C8
MRLLEQVSRLLNGYVMLVDQPGRLIAAFPRPPGGLLTRLGDDIERVAAKGISSASVSVQGDAIHILPIDVEGSPTAVLIVGRADPFTSRARRLIGDAARLIGMRWRLDELGRAQERVEKADRDNREAVLHLLLTGHLSAARRAASALGPALADTNRLYVVECPEHDRREVVARCNEAAGGRAWVVRCPLYDSHVVVLAPTPGPTPGQGPGPSHDDDDDVDARLSRALQAYAVLNSGISVGAGLEVALVDTPVGWEQAYHALAVARSSPERFARFNPQESLAGLLGPGGHSWALARLRPLLDHRPDRPQDPDARVLTETLEAWLNFYNGAARVLKVHRNTLSSRLRRVEGLLACELTDLVTQTKLSLALRMLDSPGGRQPADEPTLDELLDSDHVRQWADGQLEPFVQQDSPLLLDTLRCWLDGNANLKTAAAALGISVPGLRKRLVRAETLIGRSLLGAPSVRYDLWLALHVHDRRGNAKLSQRGDGAEPR